MNAHFEDEKTTVGNAAAMREALKDILKDVDCAKVNKQCDIDYFLSSIEKCAKAALSAPPRNCDVGTAEAQEERYLKLKREHVDRMARCPAVGTSFFFPDSLYWAQMPYEADDPAIDQLRYKMEGEAAYGND